MYPKNRATPAVLCTGTSSRTGQPCRRAPIRGGTVCASHGGLAPHVRAAAAARLANASLGMVGVLREIALNTEAADGDRIRAANSMLDRAGFRAGVELAISAGPTWEDRLAEMLVSVEPGDTRAVGGVLIDLDDDTEDAELVEGPGSMRGPHALSAAPGAADELEAEREDAELVALRKRRGTR
jgi:hypothetical protein